MARKKKPEEHENLERWLVSYADFITLLFAFFVVMYSISAVNEGKFRVLSDALVAAFRATPMTKEMLEVGSPIKTIAMKTPEMIAKPPLPVAMSGPARPINPGDAKLEAERKAAEARAATIRAMATEIQTALKDLIDKDLISVRRTSLYLEVEIKSNILFPSGSAHLSVAAIPTLETIAETLNRYPNAIHVEGFTDNVPINTVAFPSNWELSAARAASVVHLFARVGVDPDRMAAIGFGEFRPIADNATAEGRRKNRRVVLVVLADTSQKRPFELPAEPAGTTASEAPVPAAPTAAAPAAEPVKPAQPGVAEAKP
jgi:chemotaxis protein MotB